VIQDPAPFIAAAWLLSFFALGGLTLHAILSGRSANGR
jgi:hypothetical protein